MSVISPELSEAIRELADSLERTAEALSNFVTILVSGEDDD